MTKIAAIQMCSTHDLKANLAMAESLIATAAANHAELVVLPENFALMPLQPRDYHSIKESVGNGKIQTRLAQLAKKHHIWLVAGTLPLKGNNGTKLRSATLVFNAKGECIARYDKIHLFDVKLSDTEQYNESDIYEPGNQLVLVDSPFGKIGLGVCYDIRFPELFRFLWNKGAEIFALPTAFTYKTGEAHWETLAKSRAIENFCYFIGATQGGVHTNGRKTFGHPIIVEPWGNIIAEEKSPIPCIIYADTDLKKLHQIRNSMPTYDHQKIFFDVGRLST